MTRSGVVATHVRLRWRLLRGALRHGGTEQFGAVASLAASAVAGALLGGTAIVIGRGRPDAADQIVLFCTVVLAMTLGFGIVAGIAQPIDPRVLAAEALDGGDRIAGLLAASAFGPPGIAGILTGIGVAVGMTSSIASAPIVTAATLAWLSSLLLAARTATNLLSLLIDRFPRSGQLTVGLFGLGFYGVFQFVPLLLGGLDDSERGRLADVLAWTPPGQLGRALGRADDALPALGHLLAGAVWLPVLLWGFAASTGRLAVSVRRRGGLDVAQRHNQLLGRTVRRACGRGVVGAIAWRTLLVRFRTPRTALEAFTGAGIGLAAVLVPTLMRDTAGSGAVLVGGAVQLAVLFMSGNSFGSDGPALAHELMTGIAPRDLVIAKARSIAIVAAPLAALGPFIAAAVTDEWRYLAAGLGVGVGALLAGTGAALIQSALVPIAIPETDNPFASGESGKGVVAAALLVLVLTGLAALTVPVALGLLWATERGSTPLVTLFGLVTVAVGWLAVRVGVAIAVRRIAGRQPEFVAAITPAR
jgi:ABC-2 type transport system permease protein